MHESMLRIASTTSLALPTETLVQDVGPIVVVIVGALMLAVHFGKLLFRVVAEGGTGFDRRFITDPRPADALECRTTAKLPALSRR